MFTGLAPTLVLAIPSTVIYFTAYDVLHTRIKKSAHSNNLALLEGVAPVLAGASARAIAVTAFSPLGTTVFYCDNERYGHAIVIIPKM